jgi:hypothetical protein
MGAPQSPNGTQYQQLENASELVPQTLQSHVARGSSLEFDVAVPRQGVALVVLEPR